MAQRSWQYLLTKLTSLLGSFHAIPPLMMVPNSFLISHLVPRLSSEHITAKMVSCAIYNVNASNRIPAIVLKMCSPDHSPVLAKLYNKCLAKSCFPSCWNSSSLVPVFKNDGYRSYPGKYHHISLLPIISKIFESFINDSLTKHLDITGLFSDLQYGFCAFRSPADILAVLSEHIYNSLDAGGERRELTGDDWKISRRHSIRFGMPYCSTS